MTEVLYKHTFGFVSAINRGFHRKTLFWLLKHKMFLLDVITAVLSIGILHTAIIIIPSKYT